MAILEKNIFSLILHIIILTAMCIFSVSII